MIQVDIGTECGHVLFVTFDPINFTLFHFSQHFKKMDLEENVTFQDFVCLFFVHSALFSVFSPPPIRLRVY